MNTDSKSCADSSVIPRGSAVLSPRILVLIILGLGFLVKIPALMQPLVGHFASYQTINAMMSEMMLRDPLSCFFAPRSFHLMEGQPALHLLYYPIGALLAAIAHGTVGGGLDFWGRFQSALFMAGAGWFLYGIARRRFSENIALLATFFFTFSPMALVTGVSFQNEAAGIFFLLGAFWLLDKFSLSSTIAAGLLFSIAVIARLHFLVALPAFLFVCFENGFLPSFVRRGRGRSNSVRPSTPPSLPLQRGGINFHPILFLLAALIPVSLWFGFMHYVETLYPGQVLTSLFGQTHEVGIFFHPVLKKAAFYKRILEILFGNWLTPLLFPFLLFGIFLWKDRCLPLVIWTVCCLGTILVLPVKVFDHPFYLVSGLPAAMLLISCVLADLFQHCKKVVVVVFLSVYFLFGMRYYVPAAFFASQTDRNVPSIGRHVQSLTKESDRIVTWHGSGDLLYYCGRLGWVLTLEPGRWGQERRHRALRKSYANRIDMLEDIRGKGADYLVIADPKMLNSDRSLHEHLQQRYRRAQVPHDSFLMFDLRESR